MRRWIKTAFRRAGYDVTRRDARVHPEFPPDTSPFERDVFTAVKPFTMTSVERVTTLVRAVRHVVSQRVAGDIVECGVWRGGSAMAIALALLEAGDSERRIVLFDTFDGMTPPSAHDVTADGLDAAALLASNNAWVVARAPLEEVRRNLATTGFPMDRIHFVRGPVEETIPASAPERIALMRLDTDWYESTKHEFLHLYPRVSSGGITIVDDYGHWKGARAATDEYLATLAPLPFLHRIDYTARLIVKP